MSFNWSIFIAGSILGFIMIQVGKQMAKKEVEKILNKHLQDISDLHDGLVQLGNQHDEIIRIKDENITAISEMRDQAIKAYETLLVENTRLQSLLQDRNRQILEQQSLADEMQELRQTVENYKNKVVLLNSELSSAKEQYTMETLEDIRKIIESKLVGVIDENG